MATSYSDCLDLLYQTADKLKSYRDADRVENVEIHRAVNRIASSTCLSPNATPLYDTSAMHGFLIDSEVTRNATPTSPVAFKVVGTIIPGVQPPKFIDNCQRSERICLEIMTGGRFPPNGSQLSKLDACVPLEQVSLSSTLISGTETTIKTIIITKPIHSGAHRRRADNDIARGESLVERGQRIASTHIMPIASVGLQTLPVFTKPRIGIWTTGSEFALADSAAAPDVNGPYLTTACNEVGADTRHLGYLADDLKALCFGLGDTADEGDFDVLITTGAVSVGKFDYVRDALGSLSAEILFHGVSIRPGHPVLFAILPSKNHHKPIAFFGLPGNPGAAATCFRFLVVPYLRRLLDMPVEESIRALTQKYSDDNAHVNENHVIFRGKGGTDCFVPGHLVATSSGRNHVQVRSKTIPAKLEPFISSNCWVHVQSGHDVLENQIVDCYPTSLASI